MFDWNQYDIDTTNIQNADMAWEQYLLKLSPHDRVQAEREFLDQVYDAACDLYEEVRDSDPELANAFVQDMEDAAMQEQWELPECTCMYEEECEINRDIREREEVKWMTEEEWEEYVKNHPQDDDIPF